MSKNTQLHNRSAGVVTYAVPDQPSDFVRVKTLTKRKTLESVPLQNYRGEYIFNKVVNLEKNGKILSEPLSVRVVVSGSAESQNAMKQMVNDCLPQVVNMVENNSNLGFELSSNPTI